MNKTLREIEAAPLPWLRLLGAKAVWTLQAEEVRDPFSFSFFREEAPLLRFLPGFGVLFPLAALGAVAACARSPRPWVLLGAAAAWIASCALLVTSFRYRLPLVPVAAVFAGAGCVEAWRAIRARGRALAAAAAVLLVAALAARLWRHPASRNFAEEWTATGLALNHERDLAGAERAFRRALAENPGGARPGPASASSRQTAVTSNRRAPVSKGRSRWSRGRSSRTSSSRVRARRPGASQTPSAPTAALSPWRPASTTRSKGWAHCFSLSESSTRRRRSRAGRPRSPRSLRRRTSCSRGSSARRAAGPRLSRRQSAPAISTPHARTPGSRSGPSGPTAGTPSVRSKRSTAPSERAGTRDSSRPPAVLLFERWR